MRHCTGISHKIKCKNNIKYCGLVPSFSRSDLLKTVDLRCHWCSAYKTHIMSVNISRIPSFISVSSYSPVHLFLQSQLISFFPTLPRVHHSLQRTRCILSLCDCRDWGALARISFTHLLIERKIITVTESFSLELWKNNSLLLISIDSCVNICPGKIPETFLMNHFLDPNFSLKSILFYLIYYFV